MDENNRLARFVDETRVRSNNNIITSYISHNGLKSRENSQNETSSFSPRDLASSEKDSPRLPRLSDRYLIPADYSPSPRQL